ncbi:TonB-dependent receptor plug domain-containing protein [Microbulbifer rhizosphaerae]|uniref:Iron complex outermembrane receptor protein n=1 Tax=Microbulbifer rhizosphaerae TaxID=1562603 RepID=A0A7W4ZAL0_9GAMM|nr:TonB-dependent receptor [Microbulbifer rhizosphaerae]MBB3062681.1 iron complex outermembrane receptor protein [Microbulbifer rhizosphaerae]
MKNHRHLGVPSLLAMAIAATSNPLIAQEEVLEEVITIGTRVEGRSAQDSAAPVDVITGEEFVNQGDGDLSNLLRNVVPSYNVNAQPISDAASIARPANLRGLSSDSTLVLVNGKRRHRAAVISFLGGGLSDGAQGPDISVIPAIALKQVEVLRDGAAAQYGSDAIAGVINFQLKDDSDGAVVETKWGTTAEGDGDQWMVTGNVGLPLTDAGFANFSYEMREQDATSRSVQRDDAAGLIVAGNTAVQDPAQIWGQPEVKDDIKVFANLGLELGNGAEAYAFGNYASKTVDGGFYYRNPNTRPGVYGLKIVHNEGQPDEYVTYDRLVADLTGDMSGGCPVAGTPTGLDSQDAEGLAAVMADPNCFVFNEMFPGGFTPRFGGDVVDLAGVAGVRGEMDSGWGYDISVGVGRNEVEFFIYNTVNASLGSASPTEFNPGTYIQLEKNFNADFTKTLALGGTDLHFASGFEWREEQFEAQVGDQASWEVGPLVDQRFTIGSNGFPGFGPQVAGTFDRRNIALYTDAEAEVTDSLLLGAALRWEDFSDFGSTSNYKLSAHYQVLDSLAFRATTTTGFRAPTPGQSNITNVSTVFVGGELVNQGTIPPTSPVAQFYGGKQLEPEESQSFALGAVFNIGALDVTIDYFDIDVEGRLSQSQDVTLSDTDRQALVDAGITGAESLTSFKFYTNDFDTNTRGVDLVATYPLDLFGGSTDLSAAFNWTETEITDFNPETMSNLRIRQIEDNLPNTRGNISLRHAQGSWRALARVNYFGAYWEPHLEDDTLPIDVPSEVTLDLEFGYDITENASLIAGAENVLDNYPVEHEWAGIAGAKYPTTSPMGFNGAFYYMRARYEF